MKLACRAESWPALSPSCGAASRSSRAATEWNVPHHGNCGAGVVALKAGETVVRVVGLLEAFELPEAVSAALQPAATSANGKVNGAKPQSKMTRVEKTAAKQPALIEVESKKPAKGKAKPAAKAKKPVKAKN